MKVLNKALKSFIFFISLLSLAFSAEEIRANSNITALKQDANILFVGTDIGQIQSFDLKKQKWLDGTIQLDNIKNYYENNVKARIHGIDSYKGNLLILSEGDFGSKNLSVFKNQQIQTFKLPYESAKKALFVDENTIILALMSSDIILLNLKDLKPLKEFVFSHSSLNDVALNENRTKLIAGFESGELKLFDIKNWRLLTNFNEVHKDNVYQVDYKNDTILSCATDRKIGVIKNNQQKFLEKDFLIYTCALSPKGDTLAYSDNEKGIVELASSSDLKIFQSFKNLNIGIEHIIFIDDKKILLSGYTDKIIFLNLL